MIPLPNFLIPERETLREMIAVGFPDWAADSEEIRLFRRHLPVSMWACLDRSCHDGLRDATVDDESNPYPHRVEALAPSERALFARFIDYMRMTEGYGFSGPEPASRWPWSHLLTLLGASADRPRPDFLVEEEAVIAEIYRAFGAVDRRGGVSWSEKEVIDFGGSDQARREARERDVDVQWQNLVEDGRWHIFPGDFAFLDAIGYRYYLPTAMVRALRSGDGSLIFTLTHHPRAKEYYEEKWSLLDGEQRRCIQRFLLFMVAAEGFAWDGREAAKALESYWGSVT